MIDSIFVALSGMQGHQRGLNVISNNVANMNTPGFRGSTVNFADVFIGTASNDQSAGNGNSGGGLDASRTVRDMRHGDAEQTGNPLDLFLQGEGFFVLQDESGALRYTRNGQFDFKDNELLDSSQKLKVMARTATGELVPVELTNLLTSAPKATTTVTFSGYLSPDNAATTPSSKVVESLVVYDEAGGKHTLKVTFAKDTEAELPAGASVNWKITVTEDETEIGTGHLAFASGTVAPGASPMTMTLALKGTDPADISFDFGTVSGSDFGSTSSSTLAVQEQDGYAPGTITERTFDDKGVLKITYSNGQEVDGPKLALALIQDESGLVELGNATFAYQGTQPVTVREAGDDLQVISKSLELSNVDLTQEFSELILMQRGYQASSQVISTANDMLQQLFEMRSGR